MTSLGTLITTWMSGKLVGSDAGGNRYYTERSAPKGRRAKRWVIYSGQVEATKVPPEWHAWLHYTADEPLVPGAESWRKAPEVNKTGTAEAYLPPGHDLRGGRRERAAGDYEAWTP